MNEKYKDTLDELLDRPVAFNPAFKRITGSTVAALMLSQAWYWSKRTSDKDGWFYKTQEEWEKETGLTRCEQETARKHLIEKGVMEERLSNVPARLYFRILKDEIYKLLGFQFAETPHTGLLESPIHVGGDSAIIKDSENTQEIKHSNNNKIELPEGSDPSWFLNSGISSDEIAKTNASIASRKSVTDSYERAMGYNPLSWSGHKWERLLKFLQTKTTAEIETFAAWSRQPYSQLSPSKARQDPTAVIDLWPLAFQNGEAKITKANDGGSGFYG